LAVSDTFTALYYVFKEKLKKRSLKLSDSAAQTDHRGLQRKSPGTTMIMIIAFFVADHWHSCTLLIPLP